MGVLKNVKVLGEKVSVCDYKAYAFYRDRAKKRNKKNTPQYVEYGKTLTSIYKRIADAMIENTSGVYVDNFFYCVPQPYKATRPPRVNTNGGSRLTLNSHTKGGIFTFIFINLFTDKKYRMWFLDRTMHRSVKKKFSTLLKKERPTYKFYLHTILKNK